MRNLTKSIERVSLLFALSTASTLSAANGTIDIPGLKLAVNSHVTDTQRWFTEQDFNCESDNSNDWCTVETVTFNEGNWEQDRTSSDQTVMVLDYGMNFPAVMRYRSRIKAYYQYDPALKEFVDYNPQITISKAGKKVLGELDKFTFNGKPAFVPASWLSGIAPDYMDKVPGDQSNYDTGEVYSTHGTYVLTYLLEHNPKAEFVLIDWQSFAPFRQYKTEFCNKDHRTLREIMKQAKTSLVNVMNQNGVDFVNFSGGLERKHAFTDWTNNQCDGQLSDWEAGKLVNAVKPIYWGLFNNQKVLGIQAAVSDGKDLDAHDFNSRVRVDSFTSQMTDLELSENGADYWRETFDAYADQFSSHSSVDYFVNFGIHGLIPIPGFHNSTPKMISDVFGMQYRPEIYLQSSWAAPVATSVAIYEHSLQKIEKNDANYCVNAPELIQRLTPRSYLCDAEDHDNENWQRKIFAREGNGYCRIQDPLKFRKLELHRLGYVD